MKKSAAEVLREYGPFPGVERVNGVTFDGQQVWFASGDKLNALDPLSGQTSRAIDVAAHAGTAFDGKHLFQIADDRIQKIDPATGRVLATIPAPAGGGSKGVFDPISLFCQLASGAGGGVHCSTGAGGGGSNGLSASECTTVGASS